MSENYKLTIMKELSIEEKAKRYESALERCRKLYNEAKANEYTSDMEDYETIFPELKESEDERIRKEILSFCQNRADNYPNDPKYANIGNWISWLEKQAQKPAIEMKTPEESLGIDSDTYNKIVDDCLLGEQKPAWSEEDETVLDNLIYALSNDRIGNSRDEYVNWLKSLKPKNTWKPSDVQMELLKEACDKRWEPDGLDPLYRLYQALKKLSED